MSAASVRAENIGLLCNVQSESGMSPSAHLSSIHVQIDTRALHVDEMGANGESGTHYDDSAKGHGSQRNDVSTEIVNVSSKTITWGLIVVDSDTGGKTGAVFNTLNRSTGQLIKENQNVYAKIGGVYSCSPDPRWFPRQ